MVALAPQVRIGHKDKHTGKSRSADLQYSLTVQACGIKAAGLMRAMLPLRPVPPPTRRRAMLAAVLLAAVLLAADASAPVHHGDRVADADDYGNGNDYGVACMGTVGECAVARRELGGGGYIGYGAMQRDKTPCSYRGASYYNCRPSGAANPYSRGCSAITQCRG